MLRVELNVLPLIFFAKKKNANLCSIYVLIGTPDENRTHNCPLGGDCYIHLTTEAYRNFYHFTMNCL